MRDRTDEPKNPTLHSLWISFYEILRSWLSDVWAPCVAMLLCCLTPYLCPCEPAGRSQTRPAEVLRTRHHTGRRPSFRCLAVGLAITGFINFTTIIYRVSAMAWEIEPMSSKIRLWPCEPVGRIRPGRWRIFKPVGSFPLLPFPTAVYNNSVLYKNERRAYGSILHRPPTKGLPHDFYVI